MKSNRDAKLNYLIYLATPIAEYPEISKYDKFED